MFKHIMIPVDLEMTDRAARALGIAIGEARTHGADLHVVTVIPGFGMPLVASFFPDDAFEKAEREIDTRLGEYVRTHLPEDLVSSREVCRGHPAESIVEAANRREVDLIVMPSRTRSKLDQRLLGSCSSRVVELAPCSVMVVRNP